MIIGVVPTFLFNTNPALQQGGLEIKRHWNKNKIDYGRNRMQHFWDLTHIIRDYRLGYAVFILMAVFDLILTSPTTL